MIDVNMGFLGIKAFAAAVIAGSAVSRDV